MSEHEGQISQPPHLDLRGLVAVAVDRTGELRVSGGVPVSGQVRGIGSQVRGRGSIRTRVKYREGLDQGHIKLQVRVGHAIADSLRTAGTTKVTLNVPKAHQVRD